MSVWSGVRDTLLKGGGSNVMGNSAPALQRTTVMTTRGEQKSIWPTKEWLEAKCTTRYRQMIIGCIFIVLCMLHFILNQGFCTE